MGWVSRRWPQETLKQESVTDGKTGKKCEGSSEGRDFAHPNNESRELTASKREKRFHPEGLLEAKISEI